MVSRCVDTFCKCQNVHYYERSRLERDRTKLRLEFAMKGEHSLQKNSDKMPNEFPGNVFKYKLIVIKTQLYEE